MNITKLPPSKVSNLNFNGKIIQFNNFKKPKNEFQAEAQPIQDEIQDSPINPKYYQCLNNINLDTNLDINKTTFEDTKEFQEVFSYITEKLETKYNNEIEYFKNILANKNPNVIEFDTKMDDYTTILINSMGKKEIGKDNDFESSKYVLEKTSGKTRYSLADDYIEAAKLAISNIPNEASETANQVLYLSETKNGFDLSNLDEKLEIIDWAKYIYENSYGANSLDEILSKIKDTKDENGKIDFDLIKKSFKIADLLDCTISPENAIEITKKYISKDKNKKEEIYKMLEKLNQTEFAILNEDNLFSDMMDLCFDEDGSFNQARAKAVLKSCNTISAWVTNAMYKYEDLDEDIYEEDRDNLDRLNDLTKISLDALREYFNLTSVNGVYNENSQDVDQFLKDKFAKIEIM